MKLNFRKNLLLKKNLDEMKIKEELDAGIIIHRIQGRTLLTDDNGYYNNLLKQLFQ